MSNASTPPHLYKRDWETESLRFTLFPSPAAAEISPKSWWDQVVGEPSADQQAQPRIGRYQESGPFGSGELALVSQPGRIDWNYLKTLQPQLVETQPPLLEFQDKATVGRLPRAIEVFTDKISKWLKSDACPPAQRMALGGVVFYEVETREEGYVSISELLPAVQIDPKGMRELTFQVNRPRQSTIVESLEINRLSKWGVSNLIVTFHIPSQQQTISHSMGFVVRLEFDINTSADFRSEIGPDKSNAIFNELVQLGIEITEKGDIP